MFVVEKDTCEERISKRPPAPGREQLLGGYSSAKIFHSVAALISPRVSVWR